MKSKILISLIAIFLLTSCKKNDGGTKYKTLGSYDSSGFPSYLAPSDNISQGLTDFVDSIFPNQVSMLTAHPEYFQGYINTDITVTGPSEVSVTYLSQTCITANGLAFYTYPTRQPPATANDIGTITYIYPNAGPQTPLQSGDKVVLGRFNAGTTIGFVILVNAWHQQEHTVYNNVAHYYSDDYLNPETDSALQKHAVKIEYPAENKTLIGFEDTNRQSGSDNDFNDVVFYYTVTPNP